ncbi:MAG: 16S rRNA (guanine(966)-N(2))-methyltransferase RsmD [Chloroflexi bacterium]|nr:16S rRNA (guanine(966)-N(2))-methyltransferase RsmD [Chloroflexota bacterium]
MRIGGGEAGGRRLRHHLKSIRPTSGRVRLALFSMLGPDGAAGRRVLDLYAGTGAFGLEALSRGAAWVEFVERDERACEAIRKSLASLGFEERAKVHRGVAEKIAGRLEGRFDLVFADPPYADDPFAGLFESLAVRGRLAPGATVFAEHGKRRMLPRALPGLRQVDRRVYGDTAVTVYRAEGGAEGTENAAKDGPGG